MIKTYKFESDVLAEERGLGACVPVEVDVEINISTDNDEIKWSIESVKYNVSGGHITESSIYFESRAFQEEALRHVQMQLDVEASCGDLYQDWAEHKMSETENRLEDR